MNVLDQFGKLCERANQIIMKANRMWRGETEPLQSVDLMHCIKQLHERTLAVAAWKFVAAVQINDLSEQRELFYAAADQIADFGHNGLGGTAPPRAARPRDNAKSEMHDPSFHDPHKPMRS